MMDYTGDWCIELLGINAVGESLAAVLSRCKDYSLSLMFTNFIPKVEAAASRAKPAEMIKTLLIP